MYKYANVMSVYYSSRSTSSPPSDSYDIISVLSLLLVTLGVVGAFNADTANSHTALVSAGLMISAGMVIWISSWNARQRVRYSSISRPRVPIYSY